MVRLTQVGGLTVLRNSTSDHTSSSKTCPFPSRFFIETAAADEVKTTRFTDFAFAHDFRTFSVPCIAGSISSFWVIFVGTRIETEKISTCKPLNFNR